MANQPTTTDMTALPLDGGGRPDLPRTTALRWLAFILAIAGILRSVGLTHQLPVPADPDPIGLIGVALRMGTGDLNPHMFTWPAAPFYFLAGCYGIMYGVCRVLGIVASPDDFQRWFLDDPSAFFLVTRLIMVLAGMLSVWVIYRIGCLTGSRRRGVWAAGLLAVTPVEVIFCHYQKAEPFLVLTVLLALAAMIRWWQKDTAERAILSGMAIGLACAVKYNAAPLLVPALCVWLRWAFRGGTTGFGPSILRRLVPLGLALAAVFVLLNPYLLLDAREALRQLAGQKAMIQGGGDSPIHRTPVRSYLTILLPEAFGWVLYALYAAGAVWLVFRSVMKRDSSVIPLVFLVAYGAGLMTQKLVTPYYPLPLIPALALGTAGLVCEASARRPTVAWIVGLLLVAPLERSVVLAYRLAMPNPTFQAEYAVAASVPAGDRIAHRHWLPPLLPAHRHRVGSYPWPQQAVVTREHIEAFRRHGVKWFVLNPRDVGGRESELFVDNGSVVIEEIRRFSAPLTLIPFTAEAVALYRVRPSEGVPPLSMVLTEAAQTTPTQRMDVAFQGGIRLLGIDPPTQGPLSPGQTLELPTYWRLPPGSPRHLLLTGELSGAGGVLADLTHELAYGIPACIDRPGDKTCVILHRLLVRPGYRSKAGEYDVRVGLHDAGHPSDLKVVSGDGTGGNRCKVARIVVQRIPPS